MTGLQRWRASDLPALVDRINKYSIGLDDYFDRLAEVQTGRQLIILHTI